MATERPAFIDPISDFGGDVGDGPIPGWFKWVIALVVGAAVFYAFSYLEGPKLSSNHTFVEGTHVTTEDHPAEP
ncbi:MAG TPA: hypothetical protein VNB94_06810 [Mycobacteriales bacterium]|nr:hypothetical protein [Mycobacteriales bacterium]